MKKAQGKAFKPTISKNDAGQFVLTGSQLEIGAIVEAARIEADELGAEDDNGVKLGDVLGQIDDQIQQLGA